MEDSDLFYAMRLSREMGIPIGELSERITWEEFDLYLGLERMLPLVDPWAINAINCHVTACSMGAKNSKVKNYLPRKQSRKQSAEDLKQAFKSLLKIED